VRSRQGQAPRTMTSNQSRADVLERAVRAGIGRDGEILAELFTVDVRAWTPGWSASSLTELIEELDRHDDAFSDTDVQLWPLDVGGDYACVEWTAAMTHTGPLAVGATTIDGSGIRVSDHGVTVAE